MGVAYIQFAVEHPTHYQLMFGREAYPGLIVTGQAVFDLLVTTVQ